MSAPPFLCDVAGRIVKLDDAVDGEPYENIWRGSGDDDAGIDMDNVGGMLVTVAAVVDVSVVLLLRMLAVLAMDEKDAVAVAVPGLPPAPV